MQWTPPFKEHKLSSPDETLWRELKIWCTAEYFYEPRGVLSGDETLCRILDTTSQTKWF